MIRPTTHTTIVLGAAVAAMTFAGAAPARGQDPGTVSVGLSVQRTALDPLAGLAFGTAPGIGGWVGLFVLPGLGVEAGAAHTWTSSAIPDRAAATSTPLQARAVYHVPVTELFRPLVGLGLVRNGYSGAVDGSDSGVSALVGFESYVRERLAFRTDVRLDLVGAPFNDGDVVRGESVSGHRHWNLIAGVSFDLGGARRPRDADGDGVGDRLDLCPATPPGVGVDVEGCRLDDDGDGVFDEDDMCPLTPRGVSVDGVGCGLDGDDDGVFDDYDRCPDTVANVSVDLVGCALDTDLDGVPDHLDDCPDTLLGASVDPDGCRLDGDRDGVWNEDDRCPDTPRGTEVDSFGCLALFEEQVAVLVLEGVTFETNSADLTGQAKDVLDGVASALVANADVYVRVNGHTDSTGRRAYNVRLSQRRAESVVAYLASRGVELERMEALGWGPDQPVADNDTPEGRQLNRRVELERRESGGRGRLAEGG